jgi:hypothetical protein
VDFNLMPGLNLEKSIQEISEIFVHLLEILKIKMQRFKLITTFLLLTIFPSYSQILKENLAIISEKKSTYETPMVFELINIAYALTDTNRFYFNIIDTSSLYYKEVMLHFLPNQNHPLVSELNKSLSKRQLSYAYNLLSGSSYISQNGNLKRNRKVTNAPVWYLKLYSVNKKLIKDFADKTGFEKFYNQQQTYYLQSLAEVQEYLKVENIQQWLEREFPTRYDNYNIIISPLMNGFHFTQKFSQKGTKNCVMWVCDAKGWDESKYSKSQISGIYTGVVFTEIDHNYINPVSDTYKKDLEKIMGAGFRANWIKEDEYSKMYGNGYKVFNEYMTHAVYLLYTGSHYSAEDQKIIEKNRIGIMNDSRNYYRFEDFYNHLKILYASKSENETIPDLYPKIIEWCVRQNIENPVLTKDN